MSSRRPHARLVMWIRLVRLGRDPVKQYLLEVQCAHRPGRRPKRRRRASRALGWRSAPRRSPPIPPNPNQGTVNPVEARACAPSTKPSRLESALSARRATRRRSHVPNATSIKNACRANLYKLCASRRRTRVQFRPGYPTCIRFHAPSARMSAPQKIARHRCLPSVRRAHEQ